MENARKNVGFIKANDYVVTKQFKKIHKKELTFKILQGNISWSSIYKVLWYRHQDRIIYIKLLIFFIMMQKYFLKQCLVYRRWKVYMKTLCNWLMQLSQVHRLSLIPLSCMSKGLPSSAMQLALLSPARRSYY